MIIKKIKYSEYKNTDKYWCLEECELQQFNFIVGKNSTGKSRTLSVLFNTAKLISGENGSPYSNGETCIELEESNGNSKNIWKYTLDILEYRVIKEKVEYNDIILLERNDDGNGSVLYESIGQKLPVKLPEEQLAITKYQDEIQQPQINKITQWAKNLSKINFGSDLGQNRFLSEESYKKIATSNKMIDGSILEQYIVGYNSFGETFDQNIKNDMLRLNYKLKDINFGPANLDINGHFPSIFGLHAVEEGLEFDNSQVNLSQGMYRALATIISINFRLFMKTPSTILIDDIGEGLDFERSSELVKIILEKTKDSEIQILMTSNDQFIMNSVPLENWIILKRKNRNVFSFNKNNSKEKFDDFKYIGLNNFEFFSMELFERN